eukprot:6323923-Ditylum_brightwellii.AAC.1
MEAHLRKEQEQAAAGNFGQGGRTSWKLFGTCRKTKNVTPNPSIASIESYQRRVMWQPISLPLKEAI